MKRVFSAAQDFLKLEQAGGVILILSGFMAMIVANSPLYDAYSALIHSKFSFSVLGIELDKDFHFFVNDGLLAIFFLLIALELKRELIEGELSEKKNLVLPLFAALGGIFVPVMIFAYFNMGTDMIGGWPIPAATDIAIAFGVLLLLGKKVPSSLKLFLLSLAIIDDIAVIGIITFFYTENLDITYLLLSCFFILILGLMNKVNVSNFAPFALVGIALWYTVYSSGVHATISGIILGLFIPMKPRHIYDESGYVVNRRSSMLHSLEHSLHEAVNFVILPIFAFINAGVKLDMSDFEALFSPLGLGIMVALVAGKQLGVFGVSYLLIKVLKVVSKPQGASWLQIYSISALCGIGFTMGLFIADLSFDSSVKYKLPIIVASIISAIIGLVAMKISFRIKKNS